MFLFVPVNVVKNAEKGTEEKRFIKLRKTVFCLFVLYKITVTLNLVLLDLEDMQQF